MAVTTAQYGKDPKVGNEENSCVLATIDNIKWVVPLDEENTQYQEILEWVADGNTITPAE